MEQARRGTGMLQNGLIENILPEHGGRNDSWDL